MGGNIHRAVAGGRIPIAGAVAVAVARAVR